MERQAVFRFSRSGRKNCFLTVYRLKKDLLSELRAVHCLLMANPPFLAKSCGKLKG